MWVWTHWLFSCLLTVINLLIIDLWNSKDLVMVTSMKTTVLMSTGSSTHLAIVVSETMTRFGGCVWCAVADITTPSALICYNCDKLTSMSCLHPSSHVDGLSWLSLAAMILKSFCSWIHCIIWLFNVNVTLVAVFVCFLLTCITYLYIVIHTCQQARCGYISYCLFVCLFFWMVTDFSVEDKASGVKFWSAVQRRPRQEISHFCELCSPRSPKLDKLRCAWATPTRI